MAGLFKYFERQSLPTSKETGLEEVVTKEANTAVEKALVEERKETNGRKRKYTHFTPEQRAKIAKYSAECGNTAAVRHFKKEFPTLSVLVPSNCTDLLQPLDLSVNKPLKDHLRSCFQSWYSEQVNWKEERNQKTSK